MEWFGGGVLNAISTCRQERALFVVYISGKKLCMASLLVHCT